MKSGWWVRSRCDRTSPRSAGGSAVADTDCRPLPPRHTHQKVERLALRAAALGESLLNPVRFSQGDIVGDSRDNSFDSRFGASPGGRHTPAAWQDHGGGLVVARFPGQHEDLLPPRILESQSPRGRTFPSVPLWLIEFSCSSVGKANRVLLSFDKKLPGEA